ncbi:RNA polymerase subunit sigma-70 [Actinophytocola sp.]|uniref:RNA polymerase subunit sigma-70 n=1 Tax=Actinophytocola sp. TaxID=1872138 RepID=UPI002ED44DBC
MEQDVVDRAVTGDEHAFAELVEPYRRELRVHCYRMLGSLTDAEDVLQETLLAAWRGLAGFERRASVRAWLYRIATNRCLNAMRDAKRRTPPEPVPPFQPPEPSRRSEITWLQPYPDALLAGIADAAPEPAARYQTMEAVELAFVSALQRMPPRQAATLVLRDVLGFTADEVAEMLATTPTAVKGALQRARAALQADTRTPRPEPEKERDLGRRFAEAFTSADIDGVIALLTDDAWLSMPPAPHEYHGTAAIAAFLRVSFTHRSDLRVRLVPTKANGQPAYGVYLGEPGSPAGLFVLTMAGDRIHHIARFHTDALFPRFGLPVTLSGTPRPGVRTARRRGRFLR